MPPVPRRTALALPLVVTAPLARAQEAPSARPVTVIVPFAPGGGADVVARIVLAQAAPADGAFVVENRAGAGGNIGMEALARAAPDGGTLGIVSISTHGVNPTLYRRLPFDPVADFTPIALLSLQPVVVAVRADSPIRDMAGLVALKDREMTYGSSGNGTSGHMAGELLRMRAGLRTMHVPYRGSGPAWTDLLGGRVDLVVDNVQAGLPHHAGGRARILAVSSAAPIPALPGVPTVGGTVPGYAVNSWNGLAAPARLPAPVRDRLAASAAAWLRRDDLRARYRDLGIAVPEDTGPAYLAAFVRQQIAMWAPVVRESGMRAD